MEHRWGRRYDTDVAVRFVALPGTIGAGRVTNISLSGAFMETRAKLRLLTVVYIEGLDSDREHGKPGAAKRLAATVVRRCTAGVGLEWCERWAFPASQLSHVAASAKNPAAPEAPAAASAAPPAAPGGEPYGYRLEFID
jgi:hypothetical protein